jgi:hypothetical protein
VNKNTIKYLCLLLAVIVIAGILYLYRNDISNWNQLPATKTDTSSKIIVIPREPIKIESVKTIVKWRTRTVYRAVNSYITISDTVHDTTYFRSPAFSACLDTIIKKDTFNTEFKFPEMTISQEIRLHPDSVIERTIRIEIPYEKKPFWINEYSLTGTAIGAVITTGLFIWLKK